MAEVQKDFSIPLLLDFYGEMLTKKQREVFVYYYNEDLSLAEIGAISGISRQGVRDSIKRAEKQLLYFEKNLRLYEKFQNIQKELEHVKQLCYEIGEESGKPASAQLIAGKAEKIIGIVNNINI